MTSTFNLIFAQLQVTHMEMTQNHIMQIFIVYGFMTGLFSSIKLRQTRKSTTRSSLRQRQKIASDRFLKLKSRSIFTFCLKEKVIWLNL